MKKDFKGTLGMSYFSLFPVNRSKRVCCFSVFDLSCISSDSYFVIAPYFNIAMILLNILVLQLNNANTSDAEVPFLNLNLPISNCTICNKMYAKWDIFDADNVTFPLMGGDFPCNILCCTNCKIPVGFTVKSLGTGCQCVYRYFLQARTFAGIFL